MTQNVMDSKSTKIVGRYDPHIKAAYKSIDYIARQSLNPIAKSKAHKNRHRDIDW